MLKQFKSTEFFIVFSMFFFSSAFLCFLKLTPKVEAAPPPQSSVPSSKNHPASSLDPIERQIRKEEADLPKKPSTPPQLSKKIPFSTDIFRCRRKFFYRGKELDCDSNLHRDGENLRPVLQTVPSALYELNTYQRNRHSLQTLAYVGTFGALLAGVGWWAGKEVGGMEGVVIRNICLFTGGTLVGGGFLYGFWLNQTNESSLNQAIANYNAAQPTDPIVLLVDVAAPTKPQPSYTKAFWISASGLALAGAGWLIGTQTIGGLEGVAVRNVVGIAGLSVTAGAAAYAWGWIEPSANSTQVSLFPGPQLSFVFRF